MSIDQDRANAFIERLKSLTRPVKPKTRQQQVKEAAAKQKREYHTNYQVPQNHAWASTMDVPNKADRLSALADNENARKYNVRRRNMTQGSLYPNDEDFIADTNHMPFVSPRSGRIGRGADSGVENDQIMHNLGHLKPRVLHRLRQDRTAGNEWIRAVHEQSPKPKKIRGARYGTTGPRYVNPRGHGAPFEDS